MTDWDAIDDATPRDRVFLAWDGDMHFLCAWVAGEDSWCVMNSDALEDLADDGEARNRTADPILWTDLPAKPS
jgi:hypothetical protein